MVAPTATRDRGQRDIELSGLSALPSARFDAHGLVAPALVSPSLTADVTPESPFDAGGSSTTLRTFAASSSARTWRVFVDAISLSGGDVDLYIGDWPKSGMTCDGGPAGSGQEITDVYLGPAPPGKFVSDYGGAAKGAGKRCDCKSAKKIQNCEGGYWSQECW